MTGVDREPMPAPMDAKGRISLASFNAFADQLRVNSQFESAKQAFCADVTRQWLSSDLCRMLITDTGVLAVAICIVGMDRTVKPDGASMQLIIRALEAGGMASGSRVRAIIDQFVRVGAVAIIPNPVDRRRLRIVPLPALIETFGNWFDSVLPAVSVLFDLPALPQDAAVRQELARRYIMGLMLRQNLDGFTIFDGFPEVAAFMNRRQGYLLVLQLASQEGLKTEISRSRIAETFGVTAAHIAAMLSEAEERGWLIRKLPGSTIELCADFARILDTWIAREIAIVGLWLETKLQSQTA